MASRQAIDVATKFVKKSIEVQLKLTNTVHNSVRSPIYVFDSVNYFKDAATILVNNIRVYKKDDKYAVLSASAQYAFDNPNTFLEYTDNCELKTDHIGIYYN